MFMARVMIVDDEPLIAMLAEGWLEDLGHQVVGQRGLGLKRLAVEPGRRGESFRHAAQLGDIEATVAVGR